MTNIPEDFIKELNNLLGEESTELVKALNLPPITSVRLNKRKQVEAFSNEDKVPWCESGRYLKERPEFIFDPLLHAGAYYVQDASSMIYEYITSVIIGKFESYHKTDNNPSTGLRVLDMCAAPGGKTTAMINALPDGTEVVANEYTRKRVAALQENIDRWGYPNVQVTNKDSSFYAGQGENFDIVAVDAPCSGEGMMRKEEIARTQWSLNLVNQCAHLQKEILKNAVEALKPGGFLIYSTCTFNRQENEENAEFIRTELGLKPFDPEFKPEWGIPGGIGTDLPVYRFIPHKTCGEGLFLAVFQKEGEWLPSKPLRKPQSIVEKKTKDFPKIDVDKATALSYLRGESIVLPAESPKGMVTITYMGLPLGEAKNIGTRANNHYPKNRRILKR